MKSRPSIRPSIYVNSASSSPTNRVDDSKNLGVLYTNYCEKKNPVSGQYKRRFVVLTHAAVHWFQRDDGCDLFGEERGVVGLGSILNISVTDSDSTIFLLQSIDNKKRLFRCPSPTICEEWVTAIRSALKKFASQSKSKQYRKSLSARLSIAPDGGLDDASSDEVTVLLVALRSTDKELVIARSPAWDRIINVSDLTNGDKLIITTSNGGTVTLSTETIYEKAEEAIEFEIPVENVTLASSLKLTIFTDSSVYDARYSISSKSRKLLEASKSSANKILESLISDRNNSMAIILSLMVLLVGISSVRFITAETSLLLVFAVILAVHNIYILISKQAEKKRKKSQDFCIIIHGHSFTSPDVPIYEMEDEIPKRFVDGCEGDMVEARRRWDITRHWRETEGIDNILQEEQPDYFTIKNLYPHYHAGKGKDGNIVFFERPGDLEREQLLARGIKNDKLIRHFLFVTEYQWEVLCKGDQTAKGISVIDIENVKMHMLAGENMEYLKTTIGYANQHYPERSYVVYVVNAPVWFSWFWKAIKPWIHPNTQRKVRILSKNETLEGLKEHIDEELIPSYYGGKLDFGGKDSCRFNSPESVAISEYVKELNKKFNRQQEPFDNDVSKSESKDNLPPGIPGEMATPTNDRKLDNNFSPDSTYSTMSDNWSIDSANRNERDLPQNPPHKYNRYRTHTTSEN